MKPLALGIIGSGAIGGALAVRVNREFRDRIIVRFLAERDSGRAQELSQRERLGAEIVSVDGKF